MTEEESQTIVNAYERAIKPLSKLRGKGLNRFFKDLKLPWGRAVKSIRKQKEEPSAYMAELRELQPWGERLVMGGNVQGNLTSLNGVYRHSNITVSDAAIYHGNYFSLVLSICGYPRPLSTLVRQVRPQTPSISQTDLAHAPLSVSFSFHPKNLPSHLKFIKSASCAVISKLAIHITLKNRGFLLQLVE